MKVPSKEYLTKQFKNHGGKGDKRRHEKGTAYRSNYNKINWGKKDESKKSV